MRFFELQDAARGETLRLLALFALAVAATVLGVHLALALCWWALTLVSLFALEFPRLFFQVNVGVTLLLILGGWWIETSNLRGAGGAERLARRVGARESRPGVSHAEQRLCNIVDEVCIAAHMPRPLVMVMPRHQAINAFATGWDEDDAVVAVTQGALDLLTRDELQGMVAHECSHIHEGDTRLNMQLAGMVFGLELVWGFGDAIRERGGIAVLFGSAIMAMGSIGWYAGRALQASVSRQREFLADARAVQWTRSRDGLGGVLRKALTQRQEAHAMPSDPAWSATVQHLLLLGRLAERGGWFDAHPPLALRIRRIYGRSMPALPLERPEAVTWA
ncbi:MAG TPA: M48 family metalloprotease [Ramlibacter sp.]|nr:M48 family metalloprotease [Ramlibacter sp.]